MAGAMLQFIHDAGRWPCRSILVAALLSCLSVQPAMAEDFFRKIPSLARWMGDLTQPTNRLTPIDGYPISILLNDENPSPERFKFPGSTPTVRPGTDPFLNRDIPMQPN